MTNLSLEAIPSASVPPSNDNVHTQSAKDLGARLGPTVNKQKRRISIQNGKMQYIQDDDDGSDISFMSTGAMTNKSSLKNAQRRTIAYTKSASQLYKNNNNHNNHHHHHSNNNTEQSQSFSQLTNRLDSEKSSSGSPLPTGTNSLLRHSMILHQAKHQQKQRESKR